MPDAVVQIKSSKDPGAVLKELDRNLAELSNPRAVDLSGISWVSPLAIVPVAARVCALRDKGCDVRGFPPDNVARYLQAVEFPDGIRRVGGLRYGTGNFIPISRVRAVDSPDPQDLTLGTMLERYAEILGQNVVRGWEHASGTVTAISYVLQELGANVHDHSQRDHFWAMAQYWPQTGTFDICVADAGIGIYNALHRAGVVLADDAEAVLQALKGWSSKEFDGPAGQQRGTGLRTTLALITRSALRGDFILLSGTGGYWERADGSKRQFRLAQGRWDGTLAWIRVHRPESAVDIYSYLQV